MVKGLKKKGINRNLKNTSVRVRTFQEAMVKQLHYYVISMLIDLTPNTNIIQDGLIMYLAKIKITEILPKLLEI